MPGFPGPHPIPPLCGAWRVRRLNDLCLHEPWRLTHYAPTAADPPILSHARRKASRSYWR
eukprot:scaffold282341_cov26-Tisochrysis_lutea.AAC.1